jgi:hypothetical protein
MMVVIPVLASVVSAGAGNSTILSVASPPNAFSKQTYPPSPHPLPNLSLILKLLLPLLVDQVDSYRYIVIGNSSDIVIMNRQ